MAFGSSRVIPAAAVDRAVPGIEDRQNDQYFAARPFPDLPLIGQIGSI